MYHEEAPDTRLDRLLCVGGIMVALGAVVWGGLHIQESQGVVHLGEFLVLTMSVGLIAYLGWRLYTFLSTRYAIAPDLLSLRCGLQRIQIPANRVLDLCRWRNRWSWSGTVRRDLGVEEIEHLPSNWSGGPGTNWVVIYQVASGERQAVVLRPSSRMLEMLRNWYSQQNLHERFAVAVQPSVEVQLAAVSQSVAAMRSEIKASPLSQVRPAKKEQASPKRQPKKRKKR